MQMKKNDQTELIIEDMSSEGLGIGHASGMAVFVKDAVIGDRIRAKIVKVKKTYAYARLEEILSPGPDRVKPRCPVARQCGGCQIQEMSYPAQLRMKERKVRENLVRIGGFCLNAVEQAEACELQPDANDHPKSGPHPVALEDHPKSSAHSEAGGNHRGAVVLHPIRGMKVPWRYRNKAQFPIGEGKDGAIIAGFYAGHTHSIIDYHRCEIGIDENRVILETVISWMRACGVRPYREEDGTGQIRHVMTRTGFSTGDLMVVIVATVPHLREEERLVSMLREALPLSRQSVCKEAGENRITGDKKRFHLRSILLNINDERTNVILGDKTRVLFGDDFIEDRIGSLTYRISARSFYQVNPAQTSVLYQTALEYAALTGRETVWDLYCGTGTISLFLAQRARRVIGIELIPEAVENARQNAELNHIDNCTFIVGKAEDLVSDLPPADVIVVDPPRKGLDHIVIDTILRSNPIRIVYVSCDSATLARDLALLRDGGYQLQEVQPVDQFCHTVHVETVVLMSRVKE